MNLQLPQLLQDNFFAKDTLLHVDSCGAVFGVAGEPLPEMMRNDDLITGVLLACFVLTLLIYSSFKSYLAGQFRALLFVPRSNAEMPMDSLVERRLKMVMTLQTCLLFSIVFYLLTKTNVSNSFILNSDYYLIALFLGVLIGYVLFKGFLYTLVNNVFFDGKRNKHFLYTLQLLSAVQGVLLYPIVFVLVYFGLSLHFVLYYCAFVVVLGKIGAFYKSYVIFFRQKGGFLQNILYFCALEIVPFVALMETCAALVNLLKVNF